MKKSNLKRNLLTTLILMITATIIGGSAFVISNNFVQEKTISEASVHFKDEIEYSSGANVITANDIDPNDNIQFGDTISNKLGTINITRDVQFYELGYQLVEVSTNTYNQLKKLKDQLEIIQALRLYELEKNEQNYVRYVRLQEIYEQNYGSRVTEGNDATITSIRNQMNTIYLQNQGTKWTSTADNTFTINTDKYKGTKYFVVWAKMYNKATAKTYYEAEIYAVAGTHITSEHSPAISLDKNGGRILSNRQIKATATDPDAGDDIAAFEYYWDGQDAAVTRKEIATDDRTNPSTTTINAPQSVGTHILRVKAEDNAGNKSDWLEAAYFVTNNETQDTTKPTIDASGMPANGDISLDQEITIKATDNESGIYYIAYAWYKNGQNPEYTKVYVPEGNEITIYPPQEESTYKLSVFAANTTNTSTGYMTSNTLTRTYNIKDMEAPVLTISGENVYEMYVDDDIPVVHQNPGWLVFAFHVLREYPDRLQHFFHSVS